MGEDTRQAWGVGHKTEIHGFWKQAMRPNDCAGYDNDVHTNGTMRWLEMGSKIQERFDTPMPKTESMLLKLQVRQDARARCWSAKAWGYWYKKSWVDTKGELIVVWWKGRSMSMRQGEERQGMMGSLRWREDKSWTWGKQNKVIEGADASEVWMFRIKQTPDVSDSMCEQALQQEATLYCHCHQLTLARHQYTIYSHLSLFGTKLAWASWAELKPALLGMAWLGSSQFGQAMLRRAQLWQHYSWSLVLE